MEKLLKEEFGCDNVQPAGGAGGGCISSGSAYLIDGEKVFVKQNPSLGSRIMFDGEYASLEKLHKCNIVRVPKPIKVFGRGDESYFVMEYLNINSLSKQASSLGEKMARLHLHNKQLKVASEKDASYVGRATECVIKFGFHITTCCGFIPMNNDWKEDWVQFYACNRLQPQINMVLEKYRDRDALNLWPQVERNLPKLFPSTLEIVPALLHGDLWGGNAGEVESEACIFDPACSYGHSEFDLAISHMFGGFPSAYFSCYHKLIPKEPGFEKRLKLYKLFHYLNHWNHFGSGYKSTSMSLMQDIANLK
ncbi:ketosamine-3-kinase-like [Clavelina lepadiformis]|uniref:protein-ribulosamine 3-kinase n=1 Tax=Clavelina lepadiformis TaxID=159417 RepID=A0ABP0G1Z3_CLALP